MYDYSIYKNKYGEYAVPSGTEHTPTARTLARGDVWEKDTISFVEENIKDRNMVHAGTFFGDMLPAFCAFTSGTVFAFEAVTENAWCTRKTIELNNLKNIVFTAKGLGKEETVQDIGIADKKKFGGQSSFRRINNTVTELVQLTTIDKTVRGEIGIIQLDVEGHEIPALQGAINTIRKYRPILILETVNKADKFWKEEILSLGYKQTGMLHVNSVWEI